jgi:nitrite reductase/ring-hydroxylating ferredoxin subunit
MSTPAEWSTSASEIPPGQSAKFTILWRGRRVEGFVVNFRGEFHAYVNQCIHAGTPLDWWPNDFFSEDGEQLICATHGALYAPDTGRCTGGPCADGRLYRLSTHITEGRVIVRANGDGAEADNGA